jgi:hypothetical protein
VDGEDLAAEVVVAQVVADAAQEAVAVRSISKSMNIQNADACWACIALKH